MSRSWETLPCRTLYTDAAKVARMVSPSGPLLLAEHDCSLVAGTDVLNAFDRLEVTESSARSLIDAPPSGGTGLPIGDQEIKDQEVAFSLA